MSFVELMDTQDDGQDANQTTRQPSSINGSVMISQQSVIISRLEGMNNNLKNEIAKLQSDFNSKLGNMHRSIKQISIQPVVRPIRNKTKL